MSILDPTSSSMQPLNFHDIDEKPLVLFNGEIYNFQYLAELHLKERKNLNSDTKVLATLLERYSLEEIIPMINGMYSITVVDYKENKVSFARDIFGQKPLYYWANEDKWIISSDILCIQDIVKSEICTSFLSDYIRSNEDIGTRGYLGSSPTAFREINGTKPGIIYEIKQGRVKKNCRSKEEIWKKYFIGNSQDSKSEKNFEEEFSSVIKTHLNTDVPNATALSGGD